MSILIKVIYITNILLYIEEFTFVREENEIYNIQQAHLDLYVFCFYISLLFYLNLSKCLFNGLAESLSTLVWCVDMEMILDTVIMCLMLNINTDL